MHDEYEGFRSWLEDDVKGRTRQRKGTPRGRGGSGRRRGRKKR